MQKKIFKPDSYISSKQVLGKKRTSMLIKVLLSSKMELGWFWFCLCMKLRKNINTTTFIKYDNLILNILLTIFLACSSQSGVWCVMSNTGMEHC